MMLNDSRQPTNRVIQFQPKPPQKTPPACHCKDCYVEIPSGKFCPPCSANAAKGKLGFKRQ